MKRDKLTLYLLVVCLNIYDALATYYAVTHGIAEEANPIMRSLINYSPELFLLVKIPLGSGLVVLMWYVSDTAKHWTRWGIRILLAVYVLIGLSHVIQGAMLL